MIDWDEAEPVPEAREIRSVEEAISWGDEWVQAYREERRARLREIGVLQDRIFWLEAALKAAELEAYLQVNTEVLK